MDLLYPNTTYVHASHFTDEEWAARPRLGRQRLVRAADRGPDGPRLGARGDGPRATASRSACRPTSRRRRRPTSSPRCARSSARSAAASTRRRGTRTSTGSRPSPGLITSRQVLSLGDDRRGRGRRHRRPDRLADAGQEGRHRHHRRVGRERGADHRPGRRGRLRRRRLERQDRHRRRRDPQGGLPAQGRPRRRRARPSRRRATTSLSKFGEPGARLDGQGHRLTPHRSDRGRFAGVRGHPFQVPGRVLQLDPMTWSSSSPVFSIVWRGVPVE